ncbi:5-(carboxyamino)imidazole ribonucleotide synthase [Kocuria sp. HSID17582]|nr:MULTISPECIES: 5-(carboxyamino)imidazole ribonucleotide synthase [unclassified Kocuria]RUP83206.1 5-(carboxyamino)imidazole ribonucleotide synthase [Kocuria sp. HSID17590]RUQ09680.1 5-(carboxyamino)imidazole ribonucleotide synthase [Kocuria sp. HSID17582]
MNSPETGPVIGVVGGGQLARMMAPAATALGVELRVLAESPEVSAVAAVRTAPAGDYTDLDTLCRFAAEVDVLTFDHEHVPTEHLKALEAQGVAVRPGPAALVHAQDKLVMRRAVADLGLPNPEWAEVHTAEDLVAFGDRVGWPVILKTPRGGYDGKGVLRVERAEQATSGTAAEWFERSAAADSEEGLLAEEAVAFSRELSAMVARRPSGETVAWPVVESIQVAGVCDEVIAPAPGLDPEVASAAQAAAVKLAHDLAVTGVMAVELFETPGTETGFAVNELAMRPHNSGHWSMDGSVTGQFEQHLRAVLDWPLGATDVVAEAAVMKNFLGGDNQDLFAAYPAAMSAEPRAKIHNYGKSVRPGRKIGHVNVVGDAHELTALREIATHAASILRDGEDRHARPTAVDSGGTTTWGAVPAAQTGVPLVGLVMGSDSDWATMRAAAQALEELGVPYEADVVSAHRMPSEMLEYGRTAHERGLRVIIAGAGGAAHLPGMLASVTPLPVIGVPVALKTLDGMDSLLSIVQMPAGVPVATVSINGARNAGLLAARVLGSASSTSAQQLRDRLQHVAAELSEAAHRKGSALREAVARGASSKD